LAYCFIHGVHFQSDYDFSDIYLLLYCTLLTGAELHGKVKNDELNGGFMGDKLEMY
jgi:hypothetical protein